MLANGADSDEMQHFIWVFTVCKSTHLGVSGIQRVIYDNDSFQADTSWAYMEVSTSDPYFTQSKLHWVYLARPLFSQLNFTPEPIKSFVLAFITWSCLIFLPYQVPNILI